MKGGGLNCSSLSVNKGCSGLWNVCRFGVSCLYIFFYTLTPFLRFLFVALQLFELRGRYLECQSSLRAPFLHLRTEIVQMGFTGCQYLG